MADDETDVVADDGGDHRDDDHDGDVHVTRTGEDGRRDQVGLPGQRDAEVFQQHKSADREVAVTLSAAHPRFDQTPEPPPIR